MDLESQIQASAPTKPRLTPDYIESRVVRTTFTLLPSGKVLVCELLLQNGFSVRGESAVVCVENFRMDIGERIARENAIDKIWELEGYLLQQRLHEEFMEGLTK